MAWRQRSKIEARQTRGWRQPREIPRDGSVRQPAQEFQEVRDLVVESLRLFDEDHMARVAHDHLARSRDGAADLRGTHRAADEVVIAGDDERRRGDVREPVSQVERVENFLIEELKSVRVDRFGTKRVGVPRFPRTVILEVKRDLTEEEIRPLLTLAARD